MTIAILQPTARDQALARRLLAALEGEAESVEGPLARELPALFQQGRPIVAIAAVGILVRILAPLIKDKHLEPPVLAVAPDGSCVIPVLGGHRGANRLAQRIAGALGAFAAITSASDSLLGVALDDPPPGWKVRLPPQFSTFLAALVAGAPVRLVDEIGCAAWLRAAHLTFAPDAPREILVTARDEPATIDRLVYLPAVLAVGVGTARRAPADEVVGLLQRALAASGLAADAVACIASVDLKADEPAVHALAASLGVPARFWSREQLAAEAHRVASPSAVVAREIGIPSVAEAAALAAAGADSRLVVRKQTSPHATIAIALAAAPIDPQSVGRARGRVTIVGLGPGDVAHRTHAAEAALRRASDIVGYAGYLQLAGELARGKRLHGFALGEEAARCRRALELAAEGREVALVCSGDPGIYAMASPLLELLAGEGQRRPEWQRLAIEVVPGISAMQLAAARSGAPLGHDFCAISLSDLLTPAEVIERRIAAAAEAGFAIAFYNPVSARRRSLLLRAREILLRFRPADTPVVIARAVGRSGERLELTTLTNLSPEGLDMLTTVIVGAPSSRSLELPDGRRLVFTPRGYRLP